MSPPKTAKFNTLAVHAGQEPDPSTGAVIPPISLSTTFAQSAAGVTKGYDYSRSGNPTRRNFEVAVAALEGADFGLAFASGSVTTATVASLLTNGSHLISVNDVYGGTFRYFTKVLTTHGVEGNSSLLSVVFGFIRPQCAQSCHPPKHKNGVGRNPNKPYTQTRRYQSCR